MAEFLSKIEQLPYSMWVLQGPYSTILFMHGIGMAIVAGFAAERGIGQLDTSPPIALAAEPTSRRMRASSLIHLVEFSRGCSRAMNLSEGS